MPDESLESLGLKMTACQDVHKNSWKANKEEHDRIFKRLKEMDTAMRGNGHPGFNHRLRTVEEWVSGMKKLYWLGIACGVGLLINTLVMLVTHLMEGK